MSSLYCRPIPFRIPTKYPLDNLPCSPIVDDGEQQMGMERGRQSDPVWASKGFRVILATITERRPPRSHFSFPFHTHPEPVPMSSKEPTESEFRIPAMERPDGEPVADTSGMMRSLKPLLDALIRERLRIESLLDEARTVSEQLQHQLDAATMRPTIAPSVPVMPVPTATMTAATSVSSVSSSSATPAVPQDLRAERVHRVHQMWRDGATMIQIATKCEIPAGEAELMVRLLRAGESAPRPISEESAESIPLHGNHG